MNGDVQGASKAHALRVRRWTGATGALAVLGGTATMLGAAPAVAAPGETCEPTTPTATLIGDGVCELRITVDGSYNFPTSISKLSTVLVGGGSGGLASSSDYGGYGGGGGAVVYVDNVALGTDLSVVIGAGGASGAAGSPTTLEAEVADGGLAPSGGLGGSSGSGNPGSAYTEVGSTRYAFGGGQGGAATTTSAGPGVPLSAVATDATLFPPTLDGAEVFGAGGVGVELGQTAPAVVPNSGQGGGAVGGDFSSAIVGSADAGAAGVVAMRFAATPPPPAPAPAPEPALAATGATGAGVSAVAGALALLGGAVALGAAGRMRARRSS